MHTCIIGAYTYIFEFEIIKILTKNDVAGLT